MNFRNFFYILFLVLTTNAFAQYNNPYGSNINNNYPTTPSKPSAETLEKEKTERINKYVDKLKTELSLDELQFVAIKNEIISNNRNIKIVLKKENSEEAKAKEVTYLVSKLHENIKQYLNEDQKEKYDTLLEKEMLKK